jgi:hypothetical protein
MAFPHFDQSLMTSGAVEPSAICMVELCSDPPTQIFNDRLTA